MRFDQLNPEQRLVGTASVIIYEDSTGESKVQEVLPWVCQYQVKKKRPSISVTLRFARIFYSCIFKFLVSKDKSHEIKRTKIVIERDDKRRDIKSKSSERDREKLRDLERERERLEREKRRQQEIYNFTKMKVRQIFS